MRIDCTYNKIYFKELAYMTVGLARLKSTGQVSRLDTLAGAEAALNGEFLLLQRNLSLLLLTFK